MKKLGAGIIGAGVISTLHALEYLQSSAAEIVAVCDIDRETAMQRAHAWSVPDEMVFTDYRDLLARPEVDLVEILLPHHLHHRVTLDAISAGKHVSVQKPIAHSIEEADEMIEAAELADVKLKVYENAIFYPPNQKARSLVEHGEIGDLLTIRHKTISGTSDGTWEMPDSTWDWRQDRKLAGGGQWLTDDGHHTYSTSWFFFGLPERVHVWTGETKLASGRVVDLPVLASWQFPDNRYGSWEAVKAPELALHTKHYAADDWLEITGTKGVIWVTRCMGKMLDVPPVIMYRDHEIHTFSDMETGWEWSFILSTRHFIDALRRDERPLLSGEDGREILRWCLAAESSAATGARVDF